MNWFFVLVLAFTIVGGSVLIPAAIRHDKLLQELEALDDEPLAAAASEAWNRGNGHEPDPGF
jgi:hypothetical protein